MAYLCNCSGSVASSTGLSANTAVNAVTGLAWAGDRRALRVLTQAVADFLTADIGLHNGTSREGTTGN